MERYRPGTKTAAYCSFSQVLAALPLPLGHTRFVWSHMSEADRVFSRMTTPGSLPSPEEKQFLHVTSRRRGAVAGQSRVVEVVHRRLGHTALPAEQAYAAPGPEEFQSRSDPSSPSSEAPAATSVPVPPVGHLMPGWEPLLPPIQPAEAAGKIQAGIRPRPRSTKLEQSKDQPKSIKRAFADPYVADDTGTNCMRCGYLVSPVREKRGLLTCLKCR